MTTRRFTGTLYRNGGTLIHERSATALDIIRYEQDELGNNNTVLVSKETLAQIPARHTIWLCDQPDQYNGELETYELVNAQVLARDNDGGYLIYLAE